MPIVVNELEVVVAPPEGGASAGPPQAAPQPPNPLDVAAVLERRLRQQLRTFAH